MKLTRNRLKRLIKEELQSEANAPHKPIMGKAVRFVSNMRDWQSHAAHAAIEVAESARSPEDAITDIAAMVEEDVEYQCEQLRSEAEAQL